MDRQLGFCVGLLVATIAFADGPSPRSFSEPKSSDIGYKTVAEALASLKQMKGASFSSVRGWTIVTDEAHLTVWSFAPKSDPSYPAVVRRMVISTGSGSKVTLDVLCEADKASCDNLVREFSNSNFHGTGAPLENK
jgi:hypothetical protein